MSLGDIYYVLFRRKWIILIFALCGFAAAGVAALVLTPTYKSTAKLFFSYIVDNKPPVTQSPQDVSVTSAADRGSSPLNSEAEILTSFDLALKTAAFIQPSRILAQYGGGTNLTKAAALISLNLQAEAPRFGQTITLTFSHKDPSIVQQVLEQVITNYYEREDEIHLRNALFEPYLNRRHEMLSSRLADTRERLAEAKNSQGVVDVPAAMAAYAQQEGAIVQENYMAQADLAETVARVEQLKKMIPSDASAAARATNSEPATNNLTQPSEQVLSAYQRVRQHLVDLQADEAKLESRYTTNNAVVKTNLLDIRAAQAEKRQMEQENPALLVVAPAQPGNTRNAAPTVDMVGAYNAAIGRIAELQARMIVQSNELKAIRARGTNLNQLEATLRALDRSMASDEENLQKNDSSLNQNRVETDTAAGLISGIFLIENPTPPVRDTKSANAMIGIFAAGGLALGLGLAFTLELLLDRSLKRPRDVSRLKLPVFLSVPYLNGNGKMRLFTSRRKAKLLPANANGALEPAFEQSDALAETYRSLSVTGNKHNALQPFHETLRDRLIAYFEMLNLTHKPKLVAVTSCHHEAGVSTVACGLASSLSETGDGNVLLINMNVENKEVHQFYKGKLAIGIDDVLEKEKRGGAMVQDNLYVASEANNRDRLSIILPKRFGHMVDKLKASDYDYIILDMPPVTQISVTPRLARFMDIVLLVVESGKTDRDVAQRAAALLSESRAHVGLVMNKSRAYVPKRLHNDS